MPYATDGIITIMLDIEECLSSSLRKIAPDTGPALPPEYWFGRTSRIHDHLLSDTRNVRRRGFALHCATNQEHRRADFLWKRLGLKKHFDTPHYSAAVQERRPNREFFSRVTQKARLQPTRSSWWTTAPKMSRPPDGWHALLCTDELELLPNISPLPVAFH